MATSVSLGQFIAANRADLITRCLAKINNADAARPHEGDLGIPGFLDQLVEELDDAGSRTREIRANATTHGHNLFLQGFTASEVVHVYGSVCQSVTDLAVELASDFGADDFRTLNRCLDDAIAGAVSEYTRLQRLERDDQTIVKNMEAKNLVTTALTAFDALHAGSVGIGGATGALLHRSLIALQRLV